MVIQFSLAWPASTRCWPFRIIQTLTFRSTAQMILPQWPCGFIKLWSRKNMLSTCGWVADYRQEAVKINVPFLYPNNQISKILAKVVISVSLWLNGRCYEIQWPFYMTVNVLKTVSILSYTYLLTFPQIWVFMDGSKYF